MKNKCNRKCYWNYNGQCTAEDITYITDGTENTANCSVFLEKEFGHKFEKVLDDCNKLIDSMDYANLKKARYLLQNLERSLYAVRVSEAADYFQNIKAYMRKIQKGIQNTEA